MLEEAINKAERLSKEEVNIKEEREQHIVEVVSTNLEAGITKRELVVREE